jgi:hypothetical protein
MYLWVSLKKKYENFFFPLLKVILRKESDPESDPDL